VLDLLGGPGLIDQPANEERQHAANGRLLERIAQRVGEIDARSLVLESHVLVAREERELHVSNRVRRGQQLQAGEVR
jgi:hypothetical protein